MICFGNVKRKHSPLEDIFTCKFHHLKTYSLANWLPMIYLVLLLTIKGHQINTGDPVQEIQTSLLGKGNSYLLVVNPLAGCPYIICQ
jgi:hypothetical protein